jgi:quinol-cytochrome oxidoreductase complex cytochrome b subunit
MYSLGKATMPLAVLLGSGAAVGAYVKTKETIWLWGAATFFSIIPFTFIFLMPTNRYLEGVLQATNEDEVAESEK